MKITDPARLAHALDEVLNAGDMEGVLALLTDDAVLRTPSLRVVRGATALRAEVSREVAAGTQTSHRQREAVVGGGTALVIADWAMVRTGARGRPVATTGTACHVARRDPAGTWRFTVLNPMGTE
jgi:ketosteroid isomerase-like protein